MAFLFAVAMATLFAMVLLPLWVLGIWVWAALPKNRPTIILMIWLSLWFLIQLAK